MSGSTPQCEAAALPPILICKSDRDYGQVLAYAASDWGYTAESVTNGLEALQLLSTKKFGILLLGLWIPAIGALQLVRKVRTMLNGHIKIILLTSEEVIDEEVLELCNEVIIGVPRLSQVKEAVCGRG